MMESVEVLFTDAERAMREGRPDAASACYRSVLEVAPRHPRALNALGNLVLAEGDAVGATALFRQALDGDPQAAPIWLNLAFALRATGRDEEELHALERALVADPYFVIALLQKAQWLERRGRMDEAVRAYRGLLDASPPADQLPPQMREALAHATAVVAHADLRLDAAIRQAIGSRSIRSERFTHCLDVLAGRRKIYVHQPHGLHVPYLPAVQFFDRSLFPWFDALERETHVIIEELRALMHEGVANRPYVRVASGQPVNQWAALNNSLDWGALFLWENGKSAESMLERCPRTTRILRDLPLLDIPDRAPTVLFSTLQPKTRIPPHTGVTNMRSVVHLPLIVPPGCRFRVGSETREWTVGEAWAFDDTIEHEAWNDSAETRVILIIDAWNPYLDEEERNLLRITEQVIGRSKDETTSGLA